MAAGEWAHGLIRSWEHWLDLPTRVGDRLALILGAPAGSIVVHDSTTVNLYQLVHAALALAVRESPTVIASRPATISRPTATSSPASLWRVGDNSSAGFDALDDVAVVVRSLVDYRTAALVDLAAETARAADAGAVVHLGSLSRGRRGRGRSRRACVELAVGCSYKFLHGGPGAPAWSYVAPELQAGLEQPMRGWFAQREQFVMGDRFEPQSRHSPSPTRHAGHPRAWRPSRSASDSSPTPAVPAIAAKGRALNGVRPRSLPSARPLHRPPPSDPAQRGAHVAVTVADADAIHTELIRRGVITDVRPPDLILVGCAALTTRFVDVFDGVTALADALPAAS